MTDQKTPTTRKKPDTVPIADHRHVLEKVDQLVEQNKLLMSTIETLQTQQGFLMKGHKPFTESEVEAAKAKIIETSTASHRGEFRYEILPTFGEDKIPFKKPFVFQTDTSPRFVEDTEDGKVDQATARTVLTEYNNFSGSEFQPEDMVVTCTEEFARGR